MKGVILYIIVCGYFYTHSTVDASNTMRLIKDLLHNYETSNLYSLARPLFNEADALRVSFGMALITVQDIDENNVVTIITWERLLWTDMLLKWEPDEYGGVDHVMLPIDKIWRPDIVLYNSMDPVELIHGDMAVVYSDGTVLYIPARKRKVQCVADEEMRITCSLKYGSWVYDGFKLDPVFYDSLEDVDLNDYETYERFTVVDHGAVRHVKYYPCCEEPYPDLTYTFTLKRINSSP